MELDNVDTLNDLKEWLGEHMTGATVVEGAGGIVINTGLASSMGGYLSPIEKESESNECAVCGSNTDSKFGKVKDSHYGIQFVCELACWDSYEGWYCDTCKLLHDHGTTMESDNSCQKEGE